MRKAAGRRSEISEETNVRERAVLWRGGRRCGTGQDGAGGARGEKSEEPGGSGPGSA